MQIKGLGDQVGVQKRYVKIINRFIKKLQILHHTRKEFIATKPRNERIKLIRRLRSLESMLPKVSNHSRLVSSPFVHTSTNGKKIWLNKAVLISRSSINRQVSHSNYSIIKIDQIIKQLDHLKNNLNHYSVIMDNSQKASIMRIMSLYTRKPSFKKMTAVNYKLRKTPFQGIEKSEINKMTPQSKSTHTTEINKSTPQSKSTHTTRAKESIPKKMNRIIINDRKRTKLILKVPKKIKKRENYNPYAEQDLDVYIDSLLEDSVVQNLDLDKMEDNNHSW